MQAQVKWVEDFRFIGLSNSGHSIVMDGNGGASAPSPMEMVLMAAGGCSSVDVVDGMKKAGQKIHVAPRNCLLSVVIPRRNCSLKSISILSSVVKIWIKRS